MTEKKRYRYIGQEQLLKPENFRTERTAIHQLADVLEWMKKQTLGGGEITATFVVDASGNLWIASQNSEHVACARGQDILSAGEITFVLQAGVPIVAGITNQSAGYCPEPESWRSVEDVLDGIGILHPGHFTNAYIFRLCTACGQKNIVKEDWYFCGVCDSPLSQTWNFGD